MKPQLKLTISLAVMYMGFLAHFTFHEALSPKRGNAKGVIFNNPSFLLFTVNLFNTLFALLVILIRKIPFSKNPYQYLKGVIPQQLSSLCANYAVKYIDYPTFSVLKAAKPVSVMICSILFFGVKIERKRLIVVTLITIGLIIFGYSGSFGGSSFRGVLFAFCSLFMDAIYVPIVDKLKKTSGGPYMTMFFSFFWSLLIFSVISFKNIYEGFLFVQEHPELLKNLIMYGTTGAIAQIALFTALEVTNGLVISIATTTRKFFQILVSAAKFHHNLKPTQWIGVVIVFSALGIEIFLKGKKKPQNIQNNQNTEDDENNTKKEENNYLKTEETEKDK